jgi:hypothetical protein
MLAMGAGGVNEKQADDFSMVAAQQLLRPVREGQDKLWGLAEHLRIFGMHKGRRQQQHGNDGDETHQGNLLIELILV